MEERLKDVRNSLIKASQAWASGKGFDLQKAQELRRKAILLNHRHYLDGIPLYRKIAEAEGCHKDSDFQTIKEKMMLSADIFKSYEQSWLDDNDYNEMNRWLSSVFHKKVDIDMRGIKSIDKWISRLEDAGIRISYSSGTSGVFSFVPRDKEDWELSRKANIAYLAPLLANCIMHKGAGNHLLTAFADLMPMSGLLKMTNKKALPDFDAAFLGFKSGRMGNQALIEEFAPLFNDYYFLYDIEISGSALRSLRRGARTEEERKLVAALKDKIMGQREDNYSRLIDKIEKSTGKGQRIFIFGAPYQFKELCEILMDDNRKLGLKENSIALMGGGWKTFTGEAVSRETLVDMIGETLNIKPEMALEGYSMTETSALTMRCKYGRFHIPPIIEPLIFDAALNPLEGDDVKGTFGFMDTLATSHPGFLISNDYVHMVNSDCECGLQGPAILEIGRLPGAEVKGCGGIMGSFSA
ncbi:MAG: hypothetical protein PHF74_03740 [Dehalococcoidales bacterium]|nr:hypothetical protein [Dehalococcoidales bacterium]